MERSWWAWKSNWKKQKARKVLKKIRKVWHATLNTFAHQRMVVIGPWSGLVVLLMADVLLLKHISLVWALLQPDSQTLKWICKGGMGRKDGYARGNGSVVSFRTHGFWADQVEVTFFLFAERDARTLFVKNLPYRLTEEEMKNVFENAVEVRIVLNKEGSSKGYVSKGTLDICRFLDSSCILKS